MRKQNITLIVCISILLVSVPAWSKGRTIKIVIEGDNLSGAVEITDPDILTQFSIWNGPGVESRGPDGVPHPPAHLNRKQSFGRFIDWPAGKAMRRPPGLQRLEVSFFVGVPREKDTSRRYVVAYEVDNMDSRGYIYLPRWKNDLIYHGVEGNWFYASERWNELIMPIVALYSKRSPVVSEEGDIGCKVGEGSLMADGTIEFVLTDDDGKKSSRWRYETSMQEYQSVKEHIGNVQVGEQIRISCWPARLRS